MLGAGAGLRIGEALGLRVEDIDFMRRELHVRQQVVTVRCVTSIAEPKTDGSKRDVPLADTVLVELSRYLARRGDRAGLLVGGENGDPISPSRFSQTWRRILRRAGLPPTHFHDLRHGYASALISAGCSVTAVQRALGHSSATITLDVYSHLWPSDEDRTRAAIDAFLRPVSPSCQAETLEQRTPRSGA